MEAPNSKAEGPTLQTESERMDTNPLMGSNAAPMPTRSFREGGLGGSKLLKSPGILRWCQDSWIVEDLALALSVSCLVAISVILSCFHDKPADSWHSGLGINAVLSILATALKGSVVLAASSSIGQLKWAWYSQSPQPLEYFQAFDSASRGPIGALLLLWSGTRSALAITGSLIMLVALGSDATIQASTSQQSRLRLTDTATVPVAKFLDPNITSDPLLLRAIYTGTFSAQNISNNALYSGAVDVSPTGSLEALDTVTPFCSTGSCTFEPYASLAIKHQCSNITDQLQYENDGTSYRIVKLSTYPIFPPESVNQGPSLNLSGQMALDPFSFEENLDQSTFLNMSSKIMDEVTEASYNSTNLSFTEVYMILFEAATDSFQSFRCTLDLGLQLYTASIEQGLFTETPGDFIKGNWTLRTRDGIDTNPEAAKISSGSYWSLETTAAGKRYPVAVSSTGWDMIRYEVSPHFSGEIMGLSVHKCEDNYILAEAIIQLRPWNTTLDFIFESIARSVTQYLRTASVDVAIGTTQYQEQYIQVRWPWLILPVVLVLSNIVFVLSVRLQSRQLQLPSWRNSALATLLNDNNTGEGKIVCELQKGQIIPIGPHPRFGTISEIDAWANARYALGRGCHNGKPGVYTTENDSLEELDEIM
ncbi:hypothetical protein PFICI_08709 [Pestalotiopsis fici W106-1]|uniref:Uncharacterized protein n=1 Tax=Pestalotiopsis fici (strain W106-1 / CGMCC3.15140) TaxID=1229662 RepID=W3X122_PESFW|nr:uncharacterized protein PFICI_08709 [Pestalotiopsis fici W106-1]ETS78856.1 hypothetical protein PFICI_08709 [Pestalotiopsis fici W106-1]